MNNQLQTTDVQCVYYDKQNDIQGLAKQYTPFNHPNKEISEQLTLMSIIEDAIMSKYNRILILSNGVKSFINSSEFPIITMSCYNNIIQLNLRPSAPVSVLFQGGLGNRLYQLFSIYALAQKHNKSFVIDKRFITPNGHSKNDYSRFYNNFIGHIGEKIGIFKEEYKDCCNYLPLGELMTKDIPVLMQGFFQSYRYFDSIRPQIKEIVKPTEQEQEHINTKYGDLSNAVFIHYRLGDNVPENKKHYMYPVLLDYYDKAIEMMNKMNPDVKYIIISDGFAELEKYYSKSLSQLKDKVYAKEDEVMSLFLMAQCKKGGIGSNSTFSWWGAYLNDAKTIFPSRFMNGSEVQPNDLSNFFTENMIVIPV